MVTKWLVQQEQWAAQQGQRDADLVSLVLDVEWDVWAWMDKRGSGVASKHNRRQKV